MCDAEEYTISIRIETIEGERLYVARVDEFPDIEEYADSYDFARELVLDSIRTTQKVFLRKKIDLPPPREFSVLNTSGRVTLRLPKTTHARCIQEAEKDGVSLNTYLISKISDFSDTSKKSEIHSLLASMPHRICDLIKITKMNQKKKCCLTLKNTIGINFHQRIKISSDKNGSIYSNDEIVNH